MKQAVLILSGLLVAGCASSGEPDIQSAQTSIDKGREAAGRGDHRMAADHYTKALRANPESAEAYYGRGVANVQLRLDATIEGESRPYEQKAHDDFTAAIRLNPAYSDAYFNRAMVRMSLAQYKAAADDLRHAAKFKPQDPEPHLLLGRMYEHKFEDMGIPALQHYDQYVELGGREPEVVEKVRVWREISKKPAAPSSKGPTAEDEEKAKKLHEEAMRLFRDDKKEEAAKLLDMLLTTYGETKYVQSQKGPLQALRNAFKK